jgi:cytochrome b subunit of formate dehydrogenase
MASDRQFLRFPLAYRLEHWVMVGSFTTLALTGLVQKFAYSGLALAVINALGGIENVRIIHRVAATILMIEAVYHIGLIGYNLIVRRYSASLMPTVTDARVALQSFRYNLGLRKERPLQGRYTFEEKFEYFAIVWGTLVMIVTGFVLWNPIATAAVLPGEFIPAAKVVHSNEALLAVLAIILWHFYHVHLRKFNRSMFTGRMSAEDMLEEHPLELAAREAEFQHAADPGMLRRRRFLATYGVIAVISLVGIYVFVTFEQTALETVEPVDTVTVFTPPQPPPEPVLISFDSPMTSWDNGVGEFFASRCTLCHGRRVPLAGLDLTSYETAVLGGSDMPAITPNQPENSGVIQRHLNGNHPATMTREELEKLSNWILAGAPR